MEAFAGSINEKQKQFIDPEKIAKECLDQYVRLGKGGPKPTIRNDGKYEWTVLAGVVLFIENSSPSYFCIALTTGLKAFPFNKISKNGDLLHDSHAEVLARRAARHWILERLVREQQQHKNGNQSYLLDSIPYIFIRNENDQPPFRLKENVTFHLYCSTLPCGDVSSNLIVGKNGKQDHEEDLNSSILRGRKFSSSNQCHIRTKPGRPDSEPSISMSCSDKITSWILLGFQGSLLFDLIGKINFESFVIGDQAIRTDIQGRSLEEQEESLQKTLQQTKSIFKRKCGNLDTSIPEIWLTNQKFPHSRESIQEVLLAGNPKARISGPSDEQDLVACATSLVWILGNNKNKPCGIVEGHRQGASLKRLKGEPLKKSSRSALCKLDWFYAMMKAKEVLNFADQNDMILYHDHKKAITHYRKNKQMVRGTAQLKDDERIQFQNRMVDSFLLEHQPGYSQQFNDNVPLSTNTSAPLYGWLVNGSINEQFDKEGHHVEISKEGD